MKLRDILADQGEKEPKVDPDVVENGELTDPKEGDDPKKTDPE